MTDWYWHLHHEAICEPLTEPLENRLDYIRHHKPIAEVGTRLRLITPVTVELPAALVGAGTAHVTAPAVYDKAQEAYDRAREAYDKAQVNYDKAWVTYDRALTAYDKAWTVYMKSGEVLDKARDTFAPELERLHAIDCPAARAGTCPWNGTTIFPTLTPEDRP